MAVAEKENGASPTPPNATDCGDPNALSAIETVADCAPIALGVNVTLTVQLEPATMVEPQVFVWENSTELVPPTEMAMPVSDASPLLVR